MPTVVHKIQVNTSAASAFRYLSDPMHFKAFCVNVVEINEIQLQAREITNFAWAYKMVGARLEGHAEIRTEKHNQELTMRFWGGTHGILTWVLQPLDEGILLEVNLNYTIPGPLLKKHKENAIVLENEHAVDAMLTKLSSLLETYQSESRSLI